MWLLWATLAWTFWAPSALLALIGAGSWAAAEWLIERGETCMRRARDMRAARRTGRVVR